MSRGLVYVVFGSEYDKLTAHTIAYSRRFTNLPMHILTNVSDRRRCGKWSDLGVGGEVTFQYFHLPQSFNRSIKTQMDKYTPFEQSLYLDCDAVIQKPGIEKVFEILSLKKGQVDLLLNLYLVWKQGEKVVRIYANTMKKVGVSLPLRVFNGAFIGWNSYSSKVQCFFHMWNDIWDKMGRGREMPALSCSVAKSGVSVYTVTEEEDKLFSPETYNPQCVVQHNYNSSAGKDFHKEFNLPRIRQFKPFDKNPNDWSWVYV